MALTLSWQKPLSYKNQSIDLLRKSISFMNKTVNDLKDTFKVRKI